MKLYLSSQGFGNHLDRLKQMVGSDKRVLFVDNAKDYLPADERAEHVAEKKTEFEAEGFEFYELDLRNYFRSPATLKPIVEAANFVFVFGGNTFVLRRAFRYSGFDDLLVNALKNTNMTYAGSSAGSIVMTKTLHGADDIDSPYIVPEGYKEEIIWDGLGLIYPQLVPHYSGGSDAMVDYFEANNMKYETLRDGEVYVVDGKYEEKLT
ncbi:MAG TPA: Type 1 glutamine amidotransferase-like domain-containing protein [Candidatus Saccharibacteria bacterium]|nr:Type 1 glutamine amidotransferase-like domain-containing protein [Candidatus Saccharibacteria bacterium]HRK93883.1 Type 1 glutamine amidotransferase-like domain-containing protein [Candidatus Saccharibacteria bacterium]